MKLAAYGGSGTLVFTYVGGNSTTEITAVASDVIVTESDGDTVVVEDGLTDSYEIVLDVLPDANVLITATPGDAEIDLGSGPGVAINLTFTTGNWSTAQTVNVTAYDDDLYEPGPDHTTMIAHTAQSSDSNYEGTGIPSVQVTVIDNERLCGEWGYLLADFNRDCYVDMLDFAIYAIQWRDQ